MDKNLSNLLKWGIENSGDTAQESTTNTSRSGSSLTPQMIAQLMGGPSEADLMKEAIAAIKSPDSTLENKLIAFDNFEQLIENLDNANNMEKLGLWEPLREELDSEEVEIRSMTAWCIATAVQNNQKTQEKVFQLNIIPQLTDLAVNDTNQGVRKKAILALSGEVRNFQDAYNKMLEGLPESVKALTTSRDAHDMQGVDVIINGLRDASAARS